jgi:hypothetical protein
MSDNKKEEPSQMPSRQLPTPVRNQISQNQAQGFDPLNIEGMDPLFMDALDPVGLQNIADSQ